MARRARHRHTAPETGQGRATRRNLRLVGGNARAVRPVGYPSIDWPLTLAGRVLLADVAEHAGVDRRASSQVCETYRIETVAERIPGRRGPAAPTVTMGEADLIAAVHERAAGLD